MIEKAPVTLQDVLEGLELQSDEVSAYLHQPTGQVVTVSDEVLRAAEEGNAQDSGIEEAEIAAALAIMRNDPDYLPLPDRFEIDEYRMMENFASDIDDVTAKAELLRSLHGQGAFRRFKDAVLRLDLADQWYAYRDHAYERVAREWCDVHGLTLAGAEG